MTGGITRYSTTRLWTGIITLLLVTGTANSQRSTASNETSPFLHSVPVTDSPSGSVATLRKSNAIVDSPSSTLKHVGNVSSSGYQDKIGDESSDVVVAIDGNRSPDDRRISNAKIDKTKNDKTKNEKLIAKFATIDEKRDIDDDLPEFGENVDNVEIDDSSDENDREPTTKSPKIHVDGNNGDPTISKNRGKEIANDDTKKKIPEIGISLANDTNVNFNEKKFDKIPKDAVSLNDDAKGSKIVLGSKIANDSGDRHEGPKTQVEVVRNSTSPKIMRISEADDERKEVENLGSVHNVSAIGTKESTPIHETNDVVIAKEKIGDSTPKNESVAIDENDNHTKVSNDPKGRGMTFDKAVEPIINNDKITDRPVNEITAEDTEKSVKDSKFADFKPYPYAKTNYSKNSSEGRSKVDEDGRIAESIEETSGLENTIGQSQQNKKILVTEPSVVIDNSIQQFKSTDHKRPDDSSRTTASYDVTSSTTLSSLEKKEGKIETTTITDSIVTVNDTNIFFNAENDVPSHKDEATKSKNGAKDNGGGLDLTGNVITEVVAGIKNDSVTIVENFVTELPIYRTTGDSPTSRATENPSVQTTTNKHPTIGNNVSQTNADVQIDSSESMLKISSLNATEEFARIRYDQDSPDPTDSTTTSSIPISTTKIALRTNATFESSSPWTLIASEGLSMTTLLPESSSLSTNVSKSPSVSTMMPETSTTSIEPTKITSTSNPSSSSSPTSTPIPTNFPVSSNTTDDSLSIIGSKVPIVTVAPQISTDDKSPKTSETSTSSNPKDAVQSTTLNIEYVFVGLPDSSSTTESPIVSSSNPEISSSPSPTTTAESSTLFPTIAIDSTTIETTVNESTVETPDPDRINATPTTPIASIDSTPDFATTPIIHESNDSELTTIFTNQNIGQSTVTVEYEETTTSTNASVKVTTEAGSLLVTNSTDVPGIDSTVNANTTDTGRAVYTSTDVPQAVATTIVNPNATTIDPTEATNLKITTEIPEFTSLSNVPPADSTPASPIDYSTYEKPVTDFISTTSSTRTTNLPIEPDAPTTTEETGEIVTDEAIEIGNRGGVPSLVKVVFEGSWADVCPHLDVLRQTLADLLTLGQEKKTILASQIIFQQNACSTGYSTSTMTTTLPITTLLLYVVDENGNFDGEMTKILPTLYSKSPVKLQVIIRSFQLVQDSDMGNAIAVVVVSCVALICLVILAGLLFIMRKRQTRFNYGERCRPVSLDAYSLDSVSAYNSVRRKNAARASKISYGNPTFEDSSAIPSHPLNFAGLSSFCNEQNAISEEFAGIPQVTARIDELPPGAEIKNRYANVVPLPETRVSLMKINNDPLTEYINASYVRGSKSATKYYIACQGPIDSTVTDFWRMIWEQQSKVIIMLTDLVENGVEKCAEYLPPSEVTDCHRLFGDFQITLRKRETKEKYAISTLHLKNLENNTFREISHIWYLWPTNGVQSDAAGLIAVLLEARALQRGGPGPIVVHCSPGTGRTGTLIALDLGIRQYEITRTVDVPRVVYTIRRDRAGAVQTKEQYAFIYKALNLYATKLAGGALES